jgi:U4/U6 small nuclear ribonucleoprotein PRP3
MEVRMKWTGPNEGDGPPPPAATADNGDEAAEEHKFNPDNRCELVWQGMAVKRHFKGFVFQACETAEQARAVLKAKGVAHYWDQVLEHHKMGRSSSALQLRLAADSSSESDDEDNDDDEDIVMKESDEP